MNREQRRQFNRKNKTNFTKSDFDLMEAYKRIKAGNLDIKDLDVPSDFLHIDNEELVPEGTPVKLYYEGIMSRPQKDLTQEFKDWIEEHKDKILHITRQEASNSLVCLAEDVKTVKENFADEDRNIGHIPWLFDIYSDFLYEDKETGEWVVLAEHTARQEKTEKILSEE